MDVKGLKINCLGASNTRIIKSSDGIAVRDVNYPVILGLLLRCTVRNYGVSGSNITPTAGRTDSYVERVAGMDRDAGLVLIQGWGNDAGHGVPIGIPGEYGECTYCGALRSCILRIRENCPGATLLALSGLAVPDRLNPRADGLTYGDFAGAFFEVCRSEDVPCLDFSADPRLDPRDRSALPDGVHMSENACRYYAGAVADAVRSL